MTISSSGLEVNKLNPNEENPEENLEESPPSGEEGSLTEQAQETQETQPGKKDAEARIDELVGRIKELEEKLVEKGEEKIPTPPSSSASLDPKVQKAVEYLKGLGFVHKQEMEDRIRTAEDKAVLNSEHVRLGNIYSGSDGRPKYDREEVENYMRKHAVYDPQVAYDQLHKSELLDWEIKKLEEERKKKPYVEKQGRSTAEHDDNVITREKIAERVEAGDREWYERHRSKILELMAKGQL